MYLDNSVTFGKSLWSFAMKSVYVHASSIREERYYRKSNTRSQTRHFSYPSGVRTRWTMVGRFYGLLPLIAQCSKSPVRWENSCEGRFGDPFSRTTVSHASEIEYHPRSTCDRKVSSDIFLSYTPWRWETGKETYSLQMLRNYKTMQLHWSFLNGLTPKKISFQKKEMYLHSTAQTFQKNWKKDVARTKHPTNFGKIPKWNRTLMWTSGETDDPDPAKQLWEQDALKTRHHFWSTRGKNSIVIRFKKELNFTCRKEALDREERGPQGLRENRRRTCEESENASVRAPWARCGAAGREGRMNVPTWCRPVGVAEFLQWVVKVTCGSEDKTFSMATDADTTTMRRCLTRAGNSPCMCAYEVCPLGATRSERWTTPRELWEAVMCQLAVSMRSFTDLCCSCSLPVCRTCRAPFFRQALVSHLCFVAILHVRLKKTGHRRSINLPHQAFEYDIGQVARKTDWSVDGD